MANMIIGNQEIDIGQELVNTKLSLEAVVIILGRKGIISQEEFGSVRTELNEKFKKEHPEIFNE